MKIENNRSEFLEPQVLMITFPEPGKVKSRKVVTRSRARATGKFPSKKMGRFIEWESTNELNAFRLLEITAAVTSYGEQPARIDYILDNERRKHYPDVLVIKGDEKEFWEIKPAQEFEKEEYKKRSEFLKEQLPIWGYSYHTKTAEYLKREPMLSNALLLLKYSTKQITDIDRELIRLALIKTAGIPWGIAGSEFIDCNRRQVLSGLVLEGFLYVDLRLPITQETEFRLLDDSVEVIQ